MSPDSLNRIIRTAIQCLVAVLIAIPSAVAALPIEADEAAWAIGIAGFAVVILTALQNALEDAGVFRIKRPRGDVNLDS